MFNIILWVAFGTASHYIESTFSHQYLYLPATTLCIFTWLHNILSKLISMVSDSVKFLLFLLLKLFTRRTVLRMYTGMLFFFRMLQLDLGSCSCITRKQMMQRVKHTTNFIALFRWRHTHSVQWVEFLWPTLKKNHVCRGFKIVNQIWIWAYQLFQSLF